MIQPNTHLVDDEVAVERTAAYTEVGLLLDRTIKFYVEDGENLITVHYTLDEARELAEYLMHLVWTAEHS
jgi:hypothetical protein